MNTFNVIKKAQAELNALLQLINLSDDEVMNIEIMIDNHAESFDGSQSISEFVDMCHDMAKVA